LFFIRIAPHIPLASCRSHTHTHNMSVVEREQQLRTTLEEVGSNGSKLQPIAEWCLAAYQDAVAAGSAADRESVQRQTTSYVSDAIANAAYHVHLAADSLSALLDLHLVDLQQIEAKLSVASTVCSMSLEAHNLMAHSLSLSLSLSVCFIGVVRCNTIPAYTSSIQDSQS
jgi:hypothetical protein